MWGWWTESRLENVKMYVKCTLRGREPSDIPMETEWKLVDAPDLCRAHMGDGQLETEEKEATGRKGSHQFCNQSWLKEARECLM